MNLVKLYNVTDTQKVEGGNWGISENCHGDLSVKMIPLGVQLVSPQRDIFVSYLPLTVHCSSLKVHYINTLKF